MKVKLHVIGGSLQVEVDNEKVLLSLQDMIARPAEIEFPLPITIEADEPPHYTGPLPVI